jgi:hypothetical protein
MSYSHLKVLCLSNLRYEPNIARLLKKGLWHTDANRFMDWYPGED